MSVKARECALACFTKQFSAGLVFLPSPVKQHGQTGTQELTLKLLTLWRYWLFGLGLFHLSLNSSFGCVPSGP
jgi:hypothetical protein